MSSRWPLLAILALLAGAAALYTARLDQVPAAMTGDEIEFGNHALSLARTGHDLNGRPWPVLIQIGDPLESGSSSTYWYQPLLFYVIAATLRVVPFSTEAVRLPVAVIGVLNIALMFIVARQIFRSSGYGLLAAAVLAMTPAHLIMSRQALDYLCPVPFILTWLWMLSRHGELRRPAPAWMGVTLGLATFSYVAAWALTPIFLLITLVVLWIRGERGRALASVCASFAAPIAAVLLWLARHPDALQQTLNRYQQHNTEGALFRVSLYWEYFSPSFLFFAGGADPTQTTLSAGVFLLPCAALMVAGLGSFWRSGAIGRVIVIGFLLAPLPIVIAVPPTPHYYIARALLLLPFGVMLCVEGARTAFAHRWPVIGAAGVVLLAAMPLQFVKFSRDYFGDYAERSRDRFDRTNSAQLNQQLLAAADGEPGGLIYFDGNTDGRASRWLFFLNTQGRTDVWKRTRYVDAARPDDVPPGSVRVFAGPSGPIVQRRTIDHAWITP